MSKDGSGNLLGPNLTLDIDCILEDFDKNERDQEFKQVFFSIMVKLSFLSYQFCKFVKKYKIKEMMS